MDIINSFDEFWKSHPALLYGLAILIGFYGSLTLNPVLFLPFSLLLLSKNRAILVIVLTLVSALYIPSQVSLPDLKSQELKGTAHFKISSLSMKSSQFGKQWVYKGIIHSLFPYSNIKNIPVSISLPIKGDLSRPPANQDYFVEGTLKQVEPYRYTFTLEKNQPWRSVKDSFNFSEYRYMAKKYVKKIIDQKIDDPESATLLSGIATGEFDDRLMTFHFARFGLQHIMAISGFHFAILAAFLSFVLKLLLSPKKATLTLIVLLGFYFFFLGFAPSILRAWLMILISLGGLLFQKSSKSLNSIGIALIAVLLIDPLVIFQLGFQFSFITTASILMFYSSIDKGLQVLAIKRFLNETALMNSINQHGFILLTWIRQAIALSLAVNLAALPLMLFHFHYFPVLSLLYNLFFPFMISISMFLFIMSFIFPFFSIIDSINSAFTKFVLNFAYHMPQTVDYKFFFTHLNAEGLTLYFTSLFALSVFVHAFSKNLSEQKIDLQYI